jgi:hypothetical protein
MSKKLNIDISEKRKAKMALDEEYRKKAAALDAEYKAKGKTLKPASARMTKKGKLVGMSIGLARRR